jgi:hypothetical protein
MGDGTGKKTDRGSVRAVILLITIGHGRKVALLPEVSGAKWYR